MVTGASSGIGEATAKALSGAGYAVALGARRADRINELSEEISGSGGTPGMKTRSGRAGREAGSVMAVSIVASAGLPASRPRGRHRRLRERCFNI